jgi:hypothetical protein
VFGCISVAVVEGFLVREFRVLGLCTVGTVNYSACGKYVRERGSVLTDWGRVRGRVEEMGKEWMKRSRKSSWEGEQWIVLQEMEGN